MNSYRVLRIFFYSFCDYANLNLAHGLTYNYRPTVMKTSIAFKKLSFSFLFFLLIILCKDSAEKKSAIKNEEAATETIKDTVVKKDTPASSEKSNANKWNANAAAAQIKFSIKGPFGTVNGNLSGLKSTILFDENNLTASSIRASVDTKSISTGIKLRNRD